MAVSTIVSRSVSGQRSIPKIRPVKTNLVYKLGLFVTAVAMLLLPVTYLALIATLAYLTYLYATTVGLAFLSMKVNLWTLIAYATPIAAGGITVFFLIKPFFARAAESPAAPEVLAEAEHPDLFSRVRAIAASVGAPNPKEIRVDNDVNASAALRRGFRSFASHDLILTIGLPLVRGMSVRDLAGVIAHEFGHFPQGGGMRFSYTIRTINLWLSRVGYEEDHWDVWLRENMQEADFRLRPAFYIAAAAVQLSRLILRLLTKAGLLISAFLSRQMEFDADLHAIRLCGSQSLVSVQRLLPLIQVASNTAYSELRRGHRYG